MVNATVKGTLSDWRIGQNLDQNKILPWSHQLCLGFHALVKGFHHHYMIRWWSYKGWRNVCLVALSPLPLSANPLPWERPSSGKKIIETPFGEPHELGEYGCLKHTWKNALLIVDLKQDMFPPIPMLNTPQTTMIGVAGYDAESHKVVTEDGYVLTIYRWEKKKKKARVTVST